MISILSNHTMTMESNENVLKRNNGMKVGKLNKVIDKRPTILTKPSTAKNQDESYGHHDDVKIIKSTSTNNVKKEDVKIITPPQINGFINQQRTLYKPNQTHNSQQQLQLNNQSTDKLSKLTTQIPSSTLNVLAQQNSNIQQNALNNVNPQINNQVLPPLSVRLSTGPFLNSAVKLVDDNFAWQDQFQEYLLEQSDYLVIGVIGKQGVGKSTLLSLLAGNKLTDNNENMIFRPAGKDTRELAQNKTNAIQAFVTTERTILLDVQPILSSSILEKSINTERKHTNYDFKYYENYIELQSIELICFILTVCNVVLVAEDWFTDPNLYRLIQTAEMLMPNMHAPGAQDEYVEHYPHMVYVLNKSDYISNSEVQKMKKVIDKLMCDSKLVYKGSLSEFNNHLNRKRRLNSDNVNFVIIPKADGYDHDWQKSLLPEFGGLPSLDKCIKYLQREILGIKRTSFINNPMFTEKKWFAYANKVWETIKKSSMISEYNRLMT